MDYCAVVPGARPERQVDPRPSGHDQAAAPARRFHRRPPARDVPGCRIAIALLDSGAIDMPAQTRLFLCLKDNYGVLLHDPASGATAAIDAPEAAPVEAALKATGWRLTDILVTHHHARSHRRHRGAQAAPPLPRGRARRPRPRAFPLVDETVRENDKVRVGALEARVHRNARGTPPAISAISFRPTSSPSSATRCSRSAAGA